MRKKLVLWGLGVCALLGFLGIATLYFILSPHAKEAEDYDLDKMADLMVPSIIYDRHDREFQQIDIQDRRPITIEEVPFHFIQALSAAEDSRFFEHHGVDYMGMVRAMLRNIKAGSVRQGASTITQQLARQSFDLTLQKSYKRKFTEIFLARRIEKQYTKSQILELYLNRIYFGSGYYGIEAAALGYFGKEVGELTIPESATLCGLIKSPNRLSPLNNPDQSEDARNYVLWRMQREKSLTDLEYLRFKKNPLTLNHKSKGRDYVNQFIAQKVVEVLGFEAAARDGFRIYTTIDADIQRTTEESLTTHLARTEADPRFEGTTYQDYKDSLNQPDNPLGIESRKSGGPLPYLQGAAIMIDNVSGGIIALVGGRDYKDSEFNRAFRAFRPSGTAFKPFVYATAFENGYFPGSPLKDDVIDNQRVMIGGQTGILGEWGGENDAPEYEGVIPARHALVHSKNAATVRLGMKVGLSKVIDLSRKAGMTGKPTHKFNRTFLGSSEVSLAELCRAYSIFPNGGAPADALHIIKEIRDREGNIVYSTASSGIDEKVIDEISAYQVHSCLQEVIKTGTGWKATSEGALQDPYAGGKTGTSYNFTDLWFVGYNNHVTCGVWSGFDKWGKTIYRGAFSNEVCLPIWTDIMNAAYPVFGSAELPAPDGVETIEICRRSGLRATDNCYDEVKRPDGGTRFVRSTYKEIVRKGTIFDRYCQIHSKSPNLAGAASIIGPMTPDPSLVAANTNPGLNSARSIPIIAPTVIGQDPYQSVQPILKARAATLGDSDGVKRALAAEPLRIGASKTILSLDPPAPIDIPDPE
ncbi:MAG: transglycosylase domain-containing protein [Verrucomicrobiota bacterium]